MSTRSTITITITVAALFVGVLLTPPMALANGSSECDYKQIYSETREGAQEAGVRDEFLVILESNRRWNECRIRQTLEGQAWLAWKSQLSKPGAIRSYPRWRETYVVP